MGRNPAICILPTAGLLFLLVVLTSCGGSPSFGGGGKTESLTQVSLGPQSPTLAKGTNLQMTATAVYNDGRTQDVTASVTWQTSNAAVIKVDTHGSLSAMGVGSAQVSAQYQGITRTDSVTVGPAAVVSIAVTPNSSSLPVGVSEQLTATGTFTDQSTQDLTQAASWTSSGPSVAPVNATGTATAQAIGSVTVSAAVGSTSGSASVTVSPAALVSIAVAPSPSSLPIGESEQLAASGTFTDQSIRDLTQSASWSSSGPSVASVNAVGLATAKTIGNATINASVGNTTGSAQMAVTAAVPVALNILPSSISIALGSSEQLKAMATYSDGSTQDATSVVQWSSSAGDIISIDSHATEQTLTATAPANVIPLALTHYFDLAAAQASNLDPTVFVTNPGVIPSGICSMIYVFDQKQEMNECCGCKLSDSGLLTLSLENDLTGNTLTGLKPKTGSIKVVSSDLTSNPQCDPSSLTPSGLVLAWGTNVRNRGDGTSEFVETEFAPVPLATPESTSLANSCSAVQKLGGGHGVCSCGSGN